MGHCGARAQSEQSQKNESGNAIQIGTAHDVNITIAPKDKPSMQTREQKPVPPLIAVEEAWKSMLRLGKMDSEPTDAQILKILPSFAQPKDDQERERLAQEYRELWPQLRKLKSLPFVEDWKQVASKPLDDKGSKRLTFHATFQPSPVVYNNRGRMLAPPFAEIAVDMDKDGVPHGFISKGYNPYEDALK